MCKLRKYDIFVNFVPRMIGFSPIYFSIFLFIKIVIKILFYVSTSPTFSRNRMMTIFTLDYILTYLWNIRFLIIFFFPPDYSAV